MEGTERPVQGWRKARIQEWFRQYGHEYGAKDTIPILLDKVKQLPDTTVYKLEKAAEDAGHKVLWLPPKHCDLNPIELIWAQVKDWVAKHNTTYKMADVKALTEQAFTTITPDAWRKACLHCEKVEAEWWTAENLQPAMPPVVINIDDLEENDEERFSDIEEE